MVLTLPLKGCLILHTLDVPGDVADKVLPIRIAKYFLP